MRVLCSKRIEIENTNNIAHTYCMRPLNHEGKCDIKEHPLDKEKPSIIKNHIEGGERE